VSGSITPKVYKLRYGEGYEWLLPVDQQDFERLRFDGQPRGSSWTPVKMRRLTVSDQGRPLKPGDFYACSGGDMLVLGDHAKASIGRDLEQYGELLPLVCDGRPFWTLNVTSFVDALDDSKSQLLRASDTGAILMIRQLALRAAPLAGAGLFKLPQIPRGLIYATEAFKDTLAKHKLAGLELVQVWAPN
jgi:hypothetical protein